jgi:hypothetical protein
MYVVTCYIVTLTFQNVIVTNKITKKITIYVHLWLLATLTDKKQKHLEH